MTLRLHLPSSLQGWTGQGRFAPPCPTLTMFPSQDLCVAYVSSSQFTHYRNLLLRPECSWTLSSVSGLDPRDDSPKSHCPHKCQNATNFNGQVAASALPPVTSNSVWRHPLFLTRQRCSGENSACPFFSHVALEGVLPRSTPCFPWNGYPESGVRYLGTFEIEEGPCCHYVLANIVPRASTIDII